jgi:hypothetical protein
VVDQQQRLRARRGQGAQGRENTGDGGGVVLVDAGRGAAERVDDREPQLVLVKRAGERSLPGR